MPTLAALRSAFAHLFVLWAASAALAGPYDAPANYYSSATGTGSTLKSQLASIMANGQIQRSYGNFRDSAAITDQDPNNPNNILLVYNRASVSSNWDSGSTWNREHVWPQSKQPGSASNSTRGNLGDPHALRPANPSINTSRGNDPFGLEASTGTHGSVGAYYFPGDVDKGDIARQLFYSAVRYQSQGLTLVSGQPGSNQMGDLDALIAWNYSDGPDEFERRRNHAIYSSDLNPSYYTNNRNAFIDHPEFVWSVFVDQSNDTQLTLSGGSVPANGASTRSLDLGRVYVGASAPSTTMSIDLNKGGVDGTYYQVTATGDAFSDAGEYARPLELGSGVTDSFNVGLSGVSTATSGAYAGSVIVDNLDVTTGGGAGRGANDGDDQIDLSFTVLDHPIASFGNNTIETAITVDFGQIAADSGELEQALSFFNYAGVGAPSFAADLDLDSITSSGDAGVLSIDAETMLGIAQGAGQFFSALFDTSTAGVFESIYTLNLSDEDLPGEQTQSLTVTLLGEVLAATLEGDYNGDGLVDAADYTVWRNTLDSTTDLAADGDNSGQIDAGDYAVWSGNYGASALTSNAVPEPAALLLAACGLLMPRRKRYKR